MKKSILKLKKKTGMTLAETLMAVLILLLVASVVTAGIPAATRAYMNAVDAANAYSLLSTTVNALRNEFSTAWGVKVADAENVVYYSSKTGAKTKLSLTDVPTVIEYVDYNDPEYESSQENTHVLASADNLSISFSIKTPVTKPTDPPISIIQFNNFTVKKDGTEIAKLKDPDGKDLTVAIRLLRPDFNVPDLPN